MKLDNTLQLQTIQEEIDKLNDELRQKYDERRRVIRELYKIPGMSMEQVGKIIGVSRRRVFSILRSNGEEQ